MAFGWDDAAKLAIPAAGEIMGIGSAKRQVNQQKKLTRIGIDAGKEMANHNQELAMEMWDNTNYEAQIEHAKKAGMSISALYGGSGAGGATTAGGSGNVAGTASADGEVARKGMAMQNAMTIAQIKNIEADTKQKEAGAANLGAGTDLTNQNTTNAKIDQEFKELNLRIGKATENDAIAQIRETADKALWDAENAQTNKIINEETYREQIENIKNQAVGSAIYNAAMRQGIKLDQAKAIEIANSIKQKWEELKVTREGQQISKENMAKLTETMLWQAGINATGNLVGDIMDLKKMGMKGRIDQNRDDRNRRDNIRTETDSYDRNGNRTGSRVTSTRRN